GSASLFPPAARPSTRATPEMPIARHLSWLAYLVRGSNVARIGQQCQRITTEELTSQDRCPSWRTTRRCAAGSPRPAASATRRRAHVLPGTAPGGRRRQGRASAPTYAWARAVRAVITLPLCIALCPNPPVDTRRRRRI